MICVVQATSQPKLNYNIYITTMLYFFLFIFFFMPVYRVWHNKSLTTTGYSRHISAHTHPYTQAYLSIIIITIYAIIIKRGERRKKTYGSLFTDFIYAKISRFDTNK